MRSLAVLLLLFATTPALAQDTAAPPAPYVLPAYIGEPPALPPDAGAAPVQLLLQDAVLLAIEGNLGIQLEREDRSAAEGLLIASHTRFEPRLIVAYEHGNSRTPPTSSLDGAADDLFQINSDDFSIGFSQELPTATEIGVVFSSDRTSSSLGSAVDPLVVRDYLGITLRQPLLQGFGFDLRVPRYRVLRARIQSEQAALALRVTMAETVRDTEDLYWDLVLALKTWHVQSASLALAQEQLVLTQRQIDSGVLPPSDLIQAESSLAQRELSMVRAGAAIERARDQLQVALGPEQQTWRKAILPLEIPTFADVPVVLDEALQTALAQRPELAQAARTHEAAALELAVATNEMLPDVSVDVGLGVVGQDSTAAAAAAKLGSFQARAWSAGVSMTWTPVLRAGLGGLRQAQADRRSAGLLRTQVEVAVEVEVRAAARALETAGRQVLAAARFRDLAERSLEVEQRRFLDGISSNFLIAQRAGELAQAQLAELTALIAHRKARTGYELATGQLLAARGIVVD